MNLVVYTCIVDAHEPLKEPEFVTPGVRHICFTDDPDAYPETGPWELVEIARSHDPTRDSRRPKLLPQQYLSDADTSVYVDAYYVIRGDLREAVSRYLESSDLAAHAHPFRDNPFTEAEFCVTIGKDAPNTLRQQARRYRHDGLPQQARLHALGFIVRRHSPDVLAFNRLWWTELLRGSRRDQISFPYAVWRSGVRLTSLAPRDDLSNEYVAYRPVRSRKLG